MLDEEALITGCRVGDAFDSFGFKLLTLLVLNILKVALHVVIHSVFKYEP